MLHLCLERNDLVRAGTFLALAHFKLNSLAVIQSGITAAHLDFLTPGGVATETERMPNLVSVGF